MIALTYNVRDTSNIGKSKSRDRYNSMNCKKMKFTLREC